MKREGIVIWSCLTMLLAGCGDIEPGRTSVAAPVLSGLEIISVAAVPVEGSQVFPGTVESIDRGMIAARTDGRVARVFVDEGETVRAGQELLTLSDTQLPERWQESGAAFTQSREELAGAEAALVLAERTHRRYQQLFAAEAVTPQEMDRMAAELEQAQRRVQAAAAAAQRFEANRQAARVALGYSRVVAPYDARVISRLAEVGSTVMPGTPLLVLDRIGAWMVRADVPESYLGRFSLGERLTVEIPALMRTVSGTVKQVIPAADPRSRSFQVKVELEEQEGLSAGLFARVCKEEESRVAIMIPAASLVAHGQLYGVYLLDKEVLHYRLVKVGRRQGDQVEILSGLDPGDRIVGKGAERAKNGARVEG